MSENKVLAIELETWAKEQMGFSSIVRSDKREIQTDLIPVCKGTAMMSLWKDVINVIKSKKSAGDIRKNLILENLMAEALRSYTTVEENLRESTALDKEIESLELQLQSYKEDLQDIDLKVKAVKDDVKSNQMKACLHRNSSGYLRHKNFMLKSYQKWISELCATYFKHNEDTEPRSCSLALNKLFSQLENDLKSKELNSTKNHDKIDNQWCFIRELMQKFASDVIACNFQQLVDSSTAVIVEEEKAIHLQEELDGLRAKYGIEDTTEKQNALATVQNMLQNWELECVQVLTQCLNSERNAENMLLQAETERNYIIQSFQAEYNLSPTILQLLIDDLDTKVEFASVQGCLRSFQASFARLHRDIKMKTDEHNQLMKLKNEIDGFSESLAVHQTNIIEIIKHNSTVKSKIQERQSEVINAAKTCIIAKRQWLNQSCTDLLSVMHTCCSFLGHADVNKIRRIMLDNAGLTPLCHLGIYTSNSLSYRKCGHSLRFSGHRAPSSLLQRISDIKHEIARAENLQQENSDFSSNMTEKCCHVTNLAKRVEGISEETTESICRKYKTGMGVTKDALTKTQTLESMIKSWYEQPAQYQTPWVTANGMTWEEYRNKLEKL
ncbi:uncharacterized protein LOC120345794 [Styela clava]